MAQHLIRNVSARKILPQHTCHALAHVAVSLLLKGVSIEIVSKLLGHSSIKVTERHYAPWVKARQELLETEVRRIWAAADTANA